VGWKSDGSGEANVERVKICAFATQIFGLQHEANVAKPAAAGRSDNDVYIVERMVCLSDRSEFKTAPLLHSTPPLESRTGIIWIDFHER
jgi:hypothetical protein